MGACYFYGVNAIVVYQEVQSKQAAKTLRPHPKPDAPRELKGLNDDELIAHIKKRMVESGENDMVMTPLAYAHLRLLGKSDGIDFVGQASIMRTGLFALIGDYRVFVSRDAGKA